MADVQAILSRLKKVKGAGHGKWSALCPAHADKKPSLSVGLGEDGKVLLHCHSGCAVKDIIAAIGLKESDLFPDKPTTAPKPKVVARYDYTDADGNLLYQVVRRSDKSFTQRRPNGSGRWVWNMKGTPRVLYNLPYVASAPVEDWVFIVEGEKDVDNLRALNIVATTNSGGAGKWHQVADDLVLHGRQIAIIPDNDEPGREHAHQVAHVLHGRALEVKILDLLTLWPDAPTKADISDYIKHRDCLSPEDLAGGLIELAYSTPAWTPEQAEVPSTSTPLVTYQSFPVEVLPEPVRSFVTQGTEAVGCESAFVALPLLAALASAIGNTRRIQLKRAWSEPAILWAAIVGDSGTMKSPAMELALKPLRQRQGKAIKQHAEAMEEYKTEAMRYELDLTDWKKSGGQGLPPSELEPPVLRRCWCDDTTMEALAVLLQQNWRGLLMVRDELAGWLGGFDRYAQGKGSDVAKWLEMHGGRSIMVDRKTGQPRTIYVPRAAMGVTGSIQPITLQRSLGRAYFENGLAAQLLLANPPRRVKRWTEAEIDPVMEQAIAAVFDRLFDLEPIEGPDGDPEPSIVRLSPSAKAAWVQFYNEHAEQQVELSGDVRGDRPLSVMDDRLSWGDRPRPKGKESIMATIFKKKYPVPMPTGAEVVTRRGKRIARWVDGRSRPKTAELAPDGKRIYFVSDIWYARYRDADGVMRRISTGCRDEQAARKVLADRLAGVEKIKAGIITSEESKVAYHVNAPLARHIDDYLTHMEACGRSVSHRSNTRRYLERTFEACGFSRLGDLASGPMERWLLQESERGRSARSRNAFRIALVSFANWAVRNSRLLSNPFEKLPVANEAADRRRMRRPLSTDELARLLYVAERRPLAEYGRETVPLQPDWCKGRKTWTKALLTIATLDAAVERAGDVLAGRPDFIAALETRGQRNAMFHRLAAFTGLWKSELASILLRDVHLDTPPPYLELRAENEKAGRGAKLPLKIELAEMVREYIAERHRAVGNSMRVLLPDTPLVESPMLKTFNLDLAVAGIEKVDSYGRSVDIHSLRHTFGTMLARSGVAPRTAQELMRHSDIRLTTNIYQHLELVDTAGAVEMLPDLEECRGAVAISSMA